MTPRFRYWLAQLLRGARGEPSRFRGARVEFPPQRLTADIVYIIGDDECQWAAVLLCPCGCGDAIHLSLATDSRPSWRIQEHRGGSVSLLPSVWRTVGCKSHFIIYRGRIFWCTDAYAEDQFGHYTQG